MATILAHIGIGTLGVLVAGCGGTSPVASTTTASSVLGSQGSSTSARVATVPVLSPAVPEAQVLELRRGILGPDELVAALASNDTWTGELQGILFRDASPPGATASWWVCRAIAASDPPQCASGVAVEGDVLELLDESETVDYPSLDELSEDPSGSIPVYSPAAHTRSFRVHGTFFPASMSFVVDALVPSG